MKHAAATNTNDATCQLQILSYASLDADSVSFLLCKIPIVEGLVARNANFGI